MQSKIFELKISQETSFNILGENHRMYKLFNISLSINNQKVNCTLPQCIRFEKQNPNKKVEYVRCKKIICMSGTFRNVDYLEQRQPQIQSRPFQLGSHGTLLCCMMQQVRVSSYIKYRTKDKLEGFLKLFREIVWCMKIQM